MPIEIGLLSSQQDSFEHHEELSKLLNETDVKYETQTIDLLSYYAIPFLSGILCSTSK